jgi:hypothetical protein
VLTTDYGFGSQDVQPTSDGYVAPRVRATFGIVADGVSAVEVSTSRGPQQAIVDHNAFLALVEHPSLELRTTAASAVAADGRRFRVPIAPSPFGDELPPASSGGAPGPARVERAVRGGTIGGLVRREPRGQSLEDAHLGYAPFGDWKPSFARVLRPDPQSYFRVAIAPTKGGFCHYLVAPTGAGGGCTSLDVFGRSPFFYDTSLRYGRDQYAIVDGLASDDVRRLQLFLADGGPVAVPVEDNAFVVEVPRTQYPARLVAYDDAGRVIGTQQLYEPMVTHGPHRVGPYRVVRTVRGPKGTDGRLLVAASSAGGRCWKVVFEGGAGGSGCLPTHAHLPALGFAVQDGGTDSFVSGEVSSRVATVELRFASGRTTRVEPVDGFILDPVPAGEELTAASAYDAGGHRVAQRSFRRR